MTYRVKDWDTFYETCETKKLAQLRWVPVPNKHDGLGYRRIAARADRCELFTAWCLILQVASKGRKEQRGFLRRQDADLTAEDLATITGFPVSIFKKALTFFSSPEMAWLVVDGQQPPANPGDAPGTPVLNGMEGNRTEGNGTEGLPLAFARATDVLHHLNERAQRSFEDTPIHLKLIVARLAECGEDVDGCKQMINHQCSLWLGDPEMDAYLQPSTLFRKKNFRNYYDQRNRPVQPKLFQGKPRIVADHSKGF